MEKYICYKSESKASRENGKLIAENQLVGTGDGWHVVRNLYERADGSLYSVQVSGPSWEEQKVLK